MPMVYLCVAGVILSAAESIRFSEAEKQILNVSVDSVNVKVTWYVDNYVTLPNRPQDQKINIYIPEGATKSSPIVFIVNNAGWRANAYPMNTIQDSRNYDGTSDKIGVALKEKYVVVSYGARSRADGASEAIYSGHSPATVTDTKAAIRYLRFNAEALPAGDTDKIIVTGTSGGGALSTLIAASGNSEDFLPYLYEIGAAGVIRNSDGSFDSEEGIGDNVFACISYCPITDLGHGDAAYEWIFKDVREALYAEGKMNYPYASQSAIMDASNYLSSSYEDYIDHLGLKDENGKSLDSSNLRDFIARLMEKEIAESINEFGVERMTEDILGKGSRGGFGGPRGRRPAEPRENNGWIIFNEDGSFEYDLSRHLLYVARYTALKPAPAFSNIGLYQINMNEDDLFGSGTDDYCPFNPYSWDNDKLKNKVGKDDTGLSWDEFTETDAGKDLLLQIKMSCAMDYLLEGKSDSAPYWYVRHGMDDRDASWAVEATLFAAVMNSDKVKGHNLSFAWLKPHSGDYDVPEAYSWLKGVLSACN